MEGKSVDLGGGRSIKKKKKTTKKVRKSATEAKDARVRECRSDKEKRQRNRR